MKKFFLAVACAAALVASPALAEDKSCPPQMVVYATFAALANQATERAKAADEAIAAADGFDAFTPEQRQALAGLPGYADILNKGEAATDPGPDVLRKDAAAATAAADFLNTLPPEDWEAACAAMAAKP